MVLEGKPQRIEEIDMLRGLSMLTMVLLHTNAYFLSIPLVFSLWNFGQFAVPIFIFCSSYLFFIKKHHLVHWKDLFSHIKKRILRLLIPYYVFAVIYILLEWLKEPIKITPLYLFQNIFVVGGISINWLVLLFIFFTLLMPLILYLFEHKKKLFYLYTGISTVSAFLLMLYRFPFDYRLIMWLPWSLLVVLSLLIVKNEGNKWFSPVMFFFWLIIFFMLQYLQKFLRHSLTMFDNKYPPNLFHLSFGIVSIIGLYGIAKKGILSIPFIKELFSFFSKNSYPIFFIHWIVIYILTVFFHFKFTWVSFFIAVLVCTVILQMLLNGFIHFSKKSLSFFHVV